MITVEIYRNLQGQIESFRVEGHAGFDEPGRDLVCCAVSCIVQTAILGLTDVVGIQPVLHKKKGLVDCKIPKRISTSQMEKVSIIMDTMLAGLKSVELGYDEYITILER
jgi:uncharacterized protein YsxB (DUF464 family)